VARAKRARVVVITGASAGVGRATAVAFARRGASVALLARGTAGLKAASEDVSSQGGLALALECDVADAEAVEGAAARIEAELGEIDVWVNNAMASVFSPVEITTAEEFKRVTEVTYLGTVHGTMAALRRMRPRDRGTIVQVGSALAYRSIPLQAPYCAAKHAVVGFTDSLRSELIHQGSSVWLTAVHLPALNTPQFGWVKSRLPRKPQPVPPIYQPEVAADAIVWSSERRRREVFVGLPTFKAIMGQKVAPGYLDRLLARQAWEGQQFDGVADPLRPHNLWSAVDDTEDRGAHGAFDERSRPASRMMWLVKNRGALMGTAAMIAVGTLAGAAAVGRGRRALEREPITASPARARLEGREETQTPLPSGSIR
jgi:NAD(P)-dependent dehydrogenase (short-subunit alcohol dehydrogenase family)